jgi:hypothetical protein
MCVTALEHLGRLVRFRLGVKGIATVCSPKRVEEADDPTVFDFPRRYVT